MSDTSTTLIFSADGLNKSVRLLTDGLLNILRDEAAKIQLHIMSFATTFFFKSNGRTVIFEIYRYNVRVLLIRLALRNARSAALEALI